MKIGKYVLLCITLCIAEHALVIAQTNPAIKIDSLQSELKVAKEDTNKVKVFLRLSRMVQNIDPNKAANFGQLGLQLSEKLHWQQGIGKGNRFAGEAYRIASDFTKAQDYSIRALKISRELGDKKEITLSTVDLAGLYHEMADYASALVYANQALALSKETGDKSSEIASLNIIGGAFLNLSNYPKSLDAFQEALKLSKETGNKSMEGTTLGNIGLLFQLLSDNSKALDYSLQALEISRELGNKYSEALNLDNISSLYLDLKDYQKAIDCSLQGLKMSRETGMKKNEEANLNHLGYDYNAESDFPKALYYLEQSLSIGKEIQDKYSEANSLKAIGDVYEKSGNCPKAISYLKKGRGLAKEIGVSRVVQAADESLSRIYEKTGKPIEALAAYKEFISVRDSALNDYKRTEIKRKEMQFSFDTAQAYQKARQDKKDVITKLEIKNSNLQRNAFIGGGALLLLLSVVLFGRFRNERNSKRLINIEKEKSEQLGLVKNKLFSIISHDLRSPLASLDATTKLLRNGNLDTRTTDSLLNNLNISLAATINMMDSLLMWSLSQMKSLELKPTATSLKEVAEENIAIYMETALNKQINMVNDIAESSKAIVDTHLMRIVARNLISNAIKFSYSGGEVLVYAKESAEYVLFSVRDNGMGIVDEEIGSLLASGARVNSHKGTNAEEGTGVGLEICNELMKKSGGFITIESILEKGTTVTVHLPKVKLAA